jgi:hypothetical protein
VLPWVLVRLAYTRARRQVPAVPLQPLDAAQWREFHELYEFARMRGWQREQLVFGAGKFSRPGVCLEQEYLKTLLLMRLDSGNFTARSGASGSRKQLEDWSPTLVLEPPPGDGASFFVDLTSSQGPCAARIGRTPAGACCSSMPTRSTRGSSRACAGCPSRTARARRFRARCPAREQRLLLMRLAALFGPDTLAIAPRATRYSVDSDVRVVFGLQTLCAAIRDTDGRHHGVPTDGSAHEEGAGAAMEADSLQGSTIGSKWRNGRRQRNRLPARRASARGPRQARRIAGDPRSRCVVGGRGPRRIQRVEPDEVSLGVEIIARRLVLVRLRQWTGNAAATTSQGARPF